MNYDFRNRANHPYDSQIPMYKTTTSSSSPASVHHPYGSQIYPTVNQSSFGTAHPPIHASSYHQIAAPSSSQFQCGSCGEQIHCIRALIGKLLHLLLLIMETMQPRFGNLPMATPSCEKWDSHRAMLLKRCSCMTKTLAHFVDGSYFRCGEHQNPV